MTGHQNALVTKPPDVLPVIVPFPETVKNPFRDILGTESWAGLPASIRQRFGYSQRKNTTKIYVGKIIHTKMNSAGWILAQMLRVIGAPLPLDRHNAGQTAIVTVTTTHETGPHLWTRHYNRRRGFAQIIKSAKGFTGPTGIEERVGFGIGMTLTLSAENDRLMFTSHRYFCECFGFRLYIPRWLAPGKLVVGHEYLSATRFAFTLMLTHPLFGNLLNQRAEFTDMKEACHD